MTMVVGLLGQAVLSSLVLLSGCVLRRSDLQLAYVTDHSLYYCTCVRALPPCSVLSSADCSCTDHAISSLLLRTVSSALRLRHLTVWYMSSLNAARLLNNSEVHQLTLVKCSSLGRDGQSASGSQDDYFAVRDLKRLTVSYRPWGPAHSQELVLGREASEEASLGLIHSSVLLGVPTVKAYTVQTHTDSQGVLASFPNLFLSRLQLPQNSSISVTFVY